MTTTATTVAITYVDENDPAALYCWYNGQSEPQDSLLVLDLEDGELTCRYDPEIGAGIPASVYHRRALWYKIPSLTSAYANALLADALPLAERILAGADIEWDGSNHVGTLTDDADEASVELASMCEHAFADDDNSCVSTYPADDWFSGEGILTAVARIGLFADTTDEELEAMAAAEEQQAVDIAPGHTILEGVNAWLIDQRYELRETVREELVEVAEELDGGRADLLARRDELIRRQVAWNDQEVDSTRAIAARAGLSHVRVQQIAKSEVPQ